MSKALISSLMLCCLVSPVFAALQSTAIDWPLIVPERSQLVVFDPVFTTSELVAANHAISSGEAARLVQSATGGKVLRVKDVGSDFQVKVLLPNGVVKSYSVNKVTGTIS